MKALHNSRNIAYRSPYGAVPAGTSIELALDVWDAPGATVALRTWIDGEGEARYAMDAEAGSGAGTQPVRYSATLTPQATGIVWYQFVITCADGREVRYGAFDGQTGGEGRLLDWEPPSFRITVCGEDGLYEDARREIGGAIVGFLCGNRSAPALAESIRAAHENYPEPAFRCAFNLLGTDNRTKLIAQLAGMEPSDSAPDELDDYDLSACDLGLAKARLWCGSLIQMLMADEPFAEAGAMAKAAKTPEQIAAAWASDDFDCGEIARNSIELRSMLPAFGDGECTRFAANDDVFGFWRRRKDGATACVLVNGSRKDAHDVLVPMADVAVSEVVSGYDVPVLSAAEVGKTPDYAPAAERYARVHLYQLGTAVLHFHAAERLEAPMTPGLGILAHITSLPSDGKAEGARADGHLGTLGAHARSFVDLLAEAGVRYWQMLPVNPTDGHGSPYAGISAFAGNTLLLEGDPNAPVDLEALGGTRPYRAFCKREADWLEPYAAFMAIRHKVGPRKLWQNWPKEYRSFDPATIEADDDLRRYAEEWRRRQFAFECQWKDLRAYANERGVQLIGDMPIYVSADSADVWANPGIFQLGHNGKPTVVAGCPPDAFATEGQVWGNPVYDWDALERDGYSWWLRRLQRAFDLYDIVRLDHFIGFARYYQIPAGSTALEGTYRPGPGVKFFEAAHRTFGPLPIIAEDLGLITPAVRALGAACGFPGMDIVQFADGGDPLAGYAPRPNKIAYTGTHDNQTLVGYAATRYPHLDAAEVAEKLIESVLTCAADVCVLPLQDVLGLDDEARMNVPGTVEGNWTWQAHAASLDGIADHLKDLVALHQNRGR